jgi:chondroitin 4-sulfotransferase 11
MPFSSRYNCLFIHVPKTGGTTIEKVLGIYRDWPTLDLEVLRGRLVLGSQEYQLQHLSLREASQFLSEETLRTCFTFTFVRNPWDRLLSEYFSRGGSRTDEKFDRFVDRACALVTSRQKLEGKNCHFRPQVEFLDDRMCFVGRFERFQVDLNQILNELRIETTDIPHERKTSHGFYAEYYNARSRRRVAITYEADIDALNYSFGDTGGAGKP